MNGEERKRKAVRFLSDREEFNGVEIVGEYSGQHNHNFVFTCSQGKFVLRTSRETESSGNLSKENKILEFLNSRGFDFIPDIVLFNKEKDFLIQEHVGKKEVEVGELSRSRIEQWIDIISKIHSLNFSEYEDFCEEKGYEIEQLGSLNQVLEDYGSEKFFEYNKLDIRSKKIFRKVEKMIENFEFEEEGKNFLIHGDLASSTRTDGDYFYLIDWEFAKFVSLPEIDLAPFFTQSRLSESKLDELLEVYGEEINRDSTKMMGKAVKFKLIGEARWLLSQAIEMYQNDNSEWFNYVEKAQDRIKRIEDDY